ncbi:MAG: hypothetical protein GY811_21575 [Myxococcales bacterium]|nr:hypothetical protein [Myxococcales bacterium]
MLARRATEIAFLDEVPPAYQAESHTALAKALWLTPAKRVTALKSARHALALYETVEGEHEKAHEELEEWIRERSP